MPSTDDIFAPYRARTFRRLYSTASNQNGAQEHDDETSVADPYEDVSDDATAS